MLQAVAPATDWSQAAFPWLSVRPVRIGLAPVVAMSVSFSGELAWELHIANENLLLVHGLLEQAGEDHGMQPFGLLATESMRIEKGYRGWKADLVTEYTPFESALDRFVQLEKPQFPGREALVDAHADGPQRMFVSMTVECAGASPHPGDSIYAGGAVRGTVSSADYGHRVGANIAMGFVRPDMAAPGTALEVEIVGQRYPATVVEQPLYDPVNERVKA